jgi:ABC-2 type transport system permease protein
VSTEIALGGADRSRRVAASMVARLTARQAIRSGVLWGYIFGIFVASSALSYAGIYKTGTERHQLAASFASNHAAIALFGPAPQLQTVAGFTAFKTFLTLSLIGAVWGFLTSTRLLRGEEEAGRWELILSGQTTRTGAVAQALVGLGAGVFTVWAITALVTVGTGLSSTVNIAAGPALYFALALVSSAIMFIGVGAVTSQLADTRRRAAMYAASILGVCYAIRLVADAGIGFHWLIWASPLGWVEQLGPLTHPQPVALLPIVGFTAILVVGALRDRKSVV